MPLTRLSSGESRTQEKDRSGERRRGAAALPYAGYDVLAKWDTPSFDDVTRKVIAARLDQVPPIRFLSTEEAQLLDVVVSRLLPQPERSSPIPITPWIDEMLFEDRGEGYRPDGMPPMRVMWRQGLTALAAEVALAAPGGLAGKSQEEQDALLHRIQRGDVQAEWPIPAAHFFTHVLLKAAAEIYYSHPDAWSEIGFGGPASPRGYVRLGFNERDPWEAK